jgi:hypothetical protein
MRAEDTVKVTIFVAWIVLGLVIRDWILRSDLSSHKNSPPIYFYNIPSGKWLYIRTQEVRGTMFHAI